SDNTTATAAERDPDKCPSRSNAWCTADAPPDSRSELALSLRLDHTRGARMLKVVIAYIDSDTFEPIRQDLAAYGIASISAIAAGGASEERFVAPHYRGSAQVQHLAEKLRLECVIGASHLQVVKETIFRHEGRKSFMFVMDVEEAFPEESVIADSSEA